MEWLREFISKLFSWLPRLYYITPDAGGIRITLGKYYKLKGPGWYFYWPIIHEMSVISVMPQVKDLRGQSLFTKDMENVLISGAITYKVIDASKAILAVQDYDKSLMTVALGIIAEFIASKTKQECMDICALKDEILKGLREEASGWGLKIMKVAITDFGDTKNIRIVGDGSSQNLVSMRESVGIE